MNKKQVLHPMVKLQQRVSSLVNSRIVEPKDDIAKVALLFGNDWSFLKSELLAYGFSLEDPISDLLVVQKWDDECE